MGEMFKYVMLLQHRLMFYGIMAFIFFILSSNHWFSYGKLNILIIICEMVISHLIPVYMITCSLRIIVSLCLFIILHKNICNQTSSLNIWLYIMNVLFFHLDIHYFMSYNSIIQFQ